MSKKWRLAARRYEEDGPDAAERERERRIGEAAQHLLFFLDGLEGAEAVELLRASGKKILIGAVKIDGRGHSQTRHYEFKGRCETKRSGMEVRITGHGCVEYMTPDPKDVIKAALENGIIQMTDEGPDIPDVIPWLREQLDGIADAAPNLNGEEREASS